MFEGSHKYPRFFGSHSMTFLKAWNEGLLGMLQKDHPFYNKIKILENCYMGSYEIEQSVIFQQIWNSNTQHTSRARQLTEKGEISARPKMPPRAVSSRTTRTPYRSAKTKMLYAKLLQSVAPTPTLHHQRRYVWESPRFIYEPRLSSD